MIPAKTVPQITCDRLSWESGPCSVLQHFSNSTWCLGNQATIIPPCDFSVILLKLYCQEASSRPGKPRALHGLGWEISGGSRQQTLSFWPTPLPFNHDHTPNIDPRIVWFMLYQIVDPRKWNVNSFYLKFVNIKSTCFLKMKEQTELQCRCTSCTPLRT